MLLPVHYERMTGRCNTHHQVGLSVRHALTRLLGYPDGDEMCMSCIPSWHRKQGAQLRPWKVLVGGVLLLLTRVLHVPPPVSHTSPVPMSNAKEVNGTQGFLGDSLALPLHSFASQHQHKTAATSIRAKSIIPRLALPLATPSSQPAPRNTPRRIDKYTHNRENSGAHERGGWGWREQRTR